MADTDGASDTTSDTIDVVAVVVTYNSATVVEALLNSAPDAFGDLTYRMVVVDNGSTDETVAIVSARDDCVVVPSTNNGYAAGINRGAATMPRARAILALNPDVVLGSGSVPSMLAALTPQRVGIVAPLVRNEDGTTFRSLRREPTLRRGMGLGRTNRAALSEYVSDPAAYTRAHAVDWALGAALLVSRECHEQLGGWDESYFLYSEETDFCLRAADQGFATWFEPAAAVVHIGGASGQSATTHVIQAVNRVRLYRRRHSSVAGFAYLALSVLGELSWWARGNPRSSAAVHALLLPSRRPAELGASNDLVPR